MSNGRVFALQVLIKVLKKCSNNLFQSIEINATYLTINTFNNKHGLLDSCRSWIGMRARNSWLEDILTITKEYY